MLTTVYRQPRQHRLHLTKTCGVTRNSAYSNLDFDLTAELADQTRTGKLVWCGRCATAPRRRAALADLVADDFRTASHLYGDVLARKALSERATSTPDSPFPIGSHVAAHLSPERVYQVDSVEVGEHDGRTRVYLVHADGERLAFQPGVLGRMYAPAAEPLPQRKLYDGRRQEAMHVLGQADDSLVFRYENDYHGPHAPVRTVTFAELTAGSRYAAVCEHRYPEQGARCSTCNPFPSTDHLIGELVTLDPINGHGGTVSGHLLRVEEVGSFDYVAGVLESGHKVKHRVRLTRRLVELTLCNLPASS